MNDKLSAELNSEDATFIEEIKLKRDLHFITLELNRYQNMTQELLDLCQEKENLFANEIIDLVKKWQC